MNVISKLHDLRRREHECTVEIIRQLIVCYETRAYLEHGCSTLFAFLVEELMYSRSAASRRYQAMKVAMQFPQVLDMLQRHELTLCTLASAESLLSEVDAPQQLLDRISGKSKREVEKIVARARPVPKKPRESVKPVAVKAPVDPLFAAPSEPVESRISVRTTLSEADYEEFEKVRAIVSRKKPGASVEDVFVETMRFYLKQKAPKQRKATEKRRNSRHVPRAVRDEVMIRDGQRCTYVGKNGKRCSCKHNLQIDHIKPWALGGAHEPENLRVLCAAHNRHQARKTFGERAVPPVGTRSADIPNRISPAGQRRRTGPGGLGAHQPASPSPSDLGEPTPDCPVPGHLEITNQNEPEPP